MNNSIGNVLHFESRLWLDAAIGLRHTPLHLLRHGGSAVADINLADGNVVFPSIQGRRLGETRYGMLGAGIQGRVGAWDDRRDGAVVQDLHAAGQLML